MEVGFGEGLRRELSRRHGVEFGAGRAIGGGDEAVVWRVEAGRGEVVVRLAPRWRSTEELAWTHELIAFAARSIPEAIAPLVGGDGTTVFRWEGQPVAVFPLVAGAILDREDGAQRLAAAELLARLRRALPAWPGLRSRPASGQDAPETWPRPADPVEWADPALDAWHEAWLRSPGAARPPIPIHGDFYRRNLLCRDGRILGLIDWDDARLAHPLRELAWSIWELNKVVSGDDLHLDRARAFLDAYVAAGGPVASEDERAVIPLIRWHLREEARRFRAFVARGIPLSDDDYAYDAAELRAFARLRGRSVASSKVRRLEG